jgi:hypothetical protein
MLSRKFAIFLLIIFLFSLWLLGCVPSRQSQRTENIPSISNSAPVISNPSPTVPSKPLPSITLNETLPTSTNLNPSGNLSTPSNLFGFKNVVWNSFSVYLRGTTSLKDNSQLESELYKDGRIVDWWSFWPKITLINGVWLKKVSARAGNAPDRFPEFEPGYSFKIWEQSRPDTSAIFNLPFQGQNNNPNTDLKNTTWKLILLNDKSLIADTNITAGFDINGGGTIWGNSTPNYYGGKYETSAPDNLIIYGTSQTLLGSSASIEEQENTYIKCLVTVFYYKVIDNHLEIYDNQKTKTLVFEKVP